MGSAQAARHLVGVLPADSGDLEEGLYMDHREAWRAKGWLFSHRWTALIRVCFQNTRLTVGLELHRKELSAFKASLASISVVAMSTTTKNIAISTSSPPPDVRAGSSKFSPFPAAPT